MNNVVFGNIRDLLSDFFDRHEYTSISILVDENTSKHCLPVIQQLLPSHKLIQIKSGEENKNLETCAHIWQALTDEAVDRKGLLINLGGGVIGDMGGFCAATYKRGIEFINIPTTLLSMVDASVGGKLGVDFGSFKNHIGLFQEPMYVFIDPVFLKTLPEREVRSGFAEIVKHALITSPENWKKLAKTDYSEMDWEGIIPESVGIKQNVVAQDYKEIGLRKTLNFGHTIGHAIESYYLKNDPQNRLLHGEAVAIGMICELFLSVNKLEFDKGLFTEISEYLIKFFDKIEIPESYFEDISKLCLQDKKNTRNKIQAVLMASIGKPLIDSEISSEDVIEALHGYNDLNI